MLFSERFLSSLIFVLILFVNIKISIANRDECERPNPELGQVYIYENKNKCYYAFNASASRSETKTFCCNFGAHFLWLENSEENTFISVIMSNLHIDNAWIGTRKISNETIWESCSNKTKPVDYENWEVKNLNRQRTFGRLKMKENPVWISECLQHVSLPVICEKCKPGFYGNRCELGCGHCKGLLICDPIDGTCLHGCSPGWLGDTCHKTCFMGYYGTGCMFECGHCKNSTTCDSVTGFCLEGCQEGWAGYKCKIKTCPDQFYGKNCKQRCGNCKGGLTCNYQTGVCENGCEMEWKGEKCQQQVFAEGSSVSYGHSVYTVHGMDVKYKETFLVAQKRCCEKNAHLLWLESGNEENFISDNILQRMSLSSSWLGTETYDCVYKWISCNDKKGMTYQNWNVSSHAKNASHIAVKMMDSQKTAWVTIHSDIEQPYICEQCADGFYGDECQLKCNHCLNSVCDVITGYCHYGCIQGYYGRKCDINEDQGLYFNYGSTLYRAFGRYNRKNFYEAQLECCYHGFHLLWLESKEEEEFIKDHILSVIGSDLVWLGAIKKNNKYSWLSCRNETVDLIKNISSPKTNCLQGDHVYLDRFNSQWLNAYGHQFYMPFICEGCNASMYGSHCAFHCGRCANNSQCDTTTGICSQGCAIGWQGLKCDTLDNNINKSIQMNSNNERIHMDSSDGKIQMDAIDGNIYYANNYLPSNRREQIHHFPENYLPSRNRIHAYEFEKNYVNNYLPHGRGQERGYFADFIGCFVDKADRAMNALFASSNSMTVEWCKEHCRKSGHMYAALQYENQCFCGNGGYDKYGRSVQCNKPCTGNPSKICGGSWANSVYKAGDFLGCFVDRADRAMSGLFASFNSMTIAWCKLHCHNNGYMYAALQYGSQCFCGNGGYDIYGISRDCNKPCTGNSYQICGGTWANSVYKVGDSIGCFLDRTDRAMNALFASSFSMTVEWCKGYCRKNGHLYAALQSGNQCICGNGGYDKYGTSNNCNIHCTGKMEETCGGSWASSVYKVGDSIGCFIDKADRAMSGLYASSYSMTIGWCKKHCRENGYIYAAVQYGNQCFCGNGGYDKYGISENCNKHCADNPYEMCGGIWANSVYKVGDSIGCFVDKADRALRGVFVSSFSMTIDWCKGRCRDKGYMYAALQSGNQCFCGNGGYDKYGITNNCNKHCTGNPNAVCGGSWANSVYKVGNSFGCFVDKPDRALNGLFASSNSMTIEWCKGHCRSKHYMYAALQNGNQCFCGNGGYDKYGISENCNKLCTGNPGAVCGGSWANSVYRIGDFLGCFADKANRALNGLFVSYNSMTIDLCKEHCHDNQYMYAALQNGNQCFCGNGGYTKYGRSENCNMNCKGNAGEICGGYWANSVYKVGNSIGCFEDKADRTLSGLFVSSNSMTIEWCKRHCRDKRYMYAALQNGNQCFCGNGGYDKYGRSENCNMPCKGNADDMCGGIWANSVYKVGGKAYYMNNYWSNKEGLGMNYFPGNTHYVDNYLPNKEGLGMNYISDLVGCFTDKKIRAMDGKFTSSNTMSIEWCKEYCRAGKYKYAGLQFGKQCFCGNDGFDKYGSSDQCNIACSGNAAEKCGGEWANLVYKVRRKTHYVDNYWPNKEGLGMNYFPGSIGCFKDMPNRAMNKISISSDIMTVEWCKGHCRDNGYIYAALQNGNQCFCGNGGYEKYGRSSECYKQCGGNRNEICGGEWANSVYKVANEAFYVNNYFANDDGLVNHEFPDEAFYVNNYFAIGNHEIPEADLSSGILDGNNNLLEEEMELEGPVESNLPGYVGCFDKNWIMKTLGVFKNLTIPFCMNKCQKEGYKYAGLQNRSECLCGADSSGVEQTTTCNKKCEGNKQTVCGGNQSRSVYKVEGYVGCYKDHENRTFTKEIQGIGNMTITKCQTECRKTGYKYAGMQLGSKCFCGDKGYDAYGTSNECKKPCIGDRNKICGGNFTNSVYNVGDYTGCFKFNENQTYITKLQSKTMTIFLCKKICQTTGNIYAGLYNATQCLCINQLADSYEESSDCNQKCAGNNLTLCGGQNAISIYQIGGYIGCFKDAENRSLQFEMLSDKMSVKMCQDLCSTKGFKYAGVEYKKECYCGNDGYDKYGTSKNCTLNCDDTSKECGGNWAISVYLAKDSPPL